MDSYKLQVKVRKLKFEDMPRFLTWGHHSDVRYRHYDFPKYNKHELRLWYRSKRKFLRRYIFISEDQSGHLLGYMTIKHINWLTRKAEMGVVFDPSCLSKGYGTASIKELQKIFFNEMKMRTLFLKVADFNKRGQRCYEKAGFKEMGERYEPFEEQERKFELLLKTEDFFMKDNTLYTLFHYMEIKKTDFKKQMKG